MKETDFMKKETDCKFKRKYNFILKNYAKKIKEIKYLVKKKFKKYC